MELVLNEAIWRKSRVNGECIYPSAATGTQGEVSVPVTFKAILEFDSIADVHIF